MKDLIENILSFSLNEEILSVKDKIRVDVIRKFHQSLNENFQMADKIYFKTNKLNKDEIDVILSISENDSTTKFLCDVMHDYVRPQIEQAGYTFDEVIDSVKTVLSDTREFLQNYKKTIFPIKDFNILDGTGDMYPCLALRNSIIKSYKELPSVALRNSTDKRIERNINQFSDYDEKLDEFIELYNQHKHNNGFDIIKDKIFQSNTNLETWLHSITTYDENYKKEHHDWTLVEPEDVQYLVDNSDIKIKFQSNDWYMLEVTNRHDLFKLGQNSRWCFSQKTMDDDTHCDTWETYSWDGKIYALIDLQSRFYNFDTMVIIKPFITDEVEFGGYIEFETTKDGFDDSFVLFDDENPSFFYNEDNRNLNLGLAKEIWDMFIQSFDSTTQLKIIDEIKEWGSTMY